MYELAIKLSNVDEPEKWKTHVFGVPKNEVAAAYKMAIPLWVKRMLDSGQLLVHPDVAKTIKAHGWELNDLHARMAWASILATDTSPQRKKRFHFIKEKNH